MSTGVIGNTGFGTITRAPAAIVAAGGSQSAATAFDEDLVVVTGANGSKGVLLPAAMEGMSKTIVNADASSVLKVYPNTGGTINGGSANAAVSVGPGQTAQFVATSSTAWFVSLASLVSASAPQMNYIAVTTPGTLEASKAAVVDANKDISAFRNIGMTGLLSQLSGSAAAAANALLLGGGTSANPNATSVNDKFFIEYRCKTTATGGDNRLAYLRYEINGTGGGECLRAFTFLTGAVGTARGCHFSLIPSGSGAVSGLGAPVTTTLHFGTAAFNTGTVASVEAQAYADDTNAPPTVHALIRASVGGNATGAALFKNLLHIDDTNISAGDTSKMISTVSLTELPAGSIGIRMLVGSTAYRLLAVLETELN